MPVTTTYDGRYIDTSQLDAALKRLFPKERYGFMAKMGQLIITAPRELTKADFEKIRNPVNESNTSKVTADENVTSEAALSGNGTTKATADENNTNQGTVHENSTNKALVSADSTSESAVYGSNARKASVDEDSTSEATVDGRSTSQD